MQTHTHTDTRHTHNRQECSSPTITHSFKDRGDCWSWRERQGYRLVDEIVFHSLIIQSGRTRMGRSGRARPKQYASLTSSFATHKPPTYTSIYTHTCIRTTVCPTSHPIYLTFVSPHILLQPTHRSHIRTQWPAIPPFKIRIEEARFAANRKSRLFSCSPEKESYSSKLFLRHT